MKFFILSLAVCLFALSADACPQVQVASSFAQVNSCGQQVALQTVFAPAFTTFVGIPTATVVEVREVRQVHHAANVNVKVVNKRRR